MRVQTKFILAPLVPEGFRIQITTKTGYSTYPDHVRQWRLTLTEAKQVHRALGKAIVKAEADGSQRK